MPSLTLKTAKEILLVLLMRLPWQIWLERLWSRIVTVGLRKLASYKTNLYTPADAENDINTIRARSTELELNGTALATVRLGGAIGAKITDPTLPEIK